MSTEYYEAAGIVARGELKPEDLAGFRRVMQTFADGQVTITIRKGKPKRRSQRSLAQNNYLHAAAQALADHCGYTLAEMKLILMGECWGWQTVSGHEIPTKIHTADMTVEEAREFIEWLVPWATDHFPEVGLTYPEELRDTA